MTALFTAFPRLESALPRFPFACLPTPVEKLDGLGRQLKSNHLYIKRDDHSGSLYGGNKIRKLEFLLADAKKLGATRLITSGAAGSNHALATAIYGKHYGFNVTLMLTDQIWNGAIARNLLLDHATGAQMLLDATYHRHQMHLEEIALEYTIAEGIQPYIIPPGGSSPIGAIGYVNAALELAQQISRGEIPEPSIIFVALGTMGTAVGLSLGCAVAKIKSRICAVRVVPDVVADIEKCAVLFNRCNALLKNLDPAFPACTFNRSRFTIDDSFFGEDYGVATPEALAAIDTFFSAEHVQLDPVYTGKTAAAFLAAARRPDMADKPLLFINTKSSILPELPPDASDYRRLPAEFHRYFTPPVS